MQIGKRSKGRWLVMQAFGSSPQYGRFIEARSQGVVRAVGQETFAGRRDPAMHITRPAGNSPEAASDASYRRREL
jgi:hypothetical protein